MEVNMNKLTAILIFLLLGFAAFADGAIASLVEGNVFYISGPRWIKINQGDIIPEGSRVFSGNNSRIILDIAGDSVEVAALTDFTVVSSRANDDASVLFVRAGSLLAKVEKARDTDNEVRFQIQSPVATASVRGTTFAFNGIELVVEEGDVQLKNILGQRHSVRGGQKSRAFGNENISSVEVYLRRSTSIE
jgi:hypothetical protein